MKSVEEEFETLLDEITNDLSDAKYRSKLYRNLEDSLSEYEREINQSIGFWGIVFNNLIEGSSLPLCRVYDSYPGTVSLIELLNFIKNNIEIFDTLKFRERLKTNPDVETLSQSERKPTQTQLERDIELVNKSNPLVQKLIKVRHNIIAHKNTNQALGKKNAISPLSWAG